MTLSASTPDQDVELLDNDTNTHKIKSRSVAIRRAIRLLRASELGDAYTAALTECSDDPATRRRRPLMPRRETRLVALDPTLGNEAAQTRQAAIVSNGGANTAAARLARGAITVSDHGRPDHLEPGSHHSIQLLLTTKETGLGSDTEAQAEQVRSVRRRASKVMRSDQAAIKPSNNQPEQQHPDQQSTHVHISPLSALLA